MKDFKLKAIRMAGRLWGNRFARVAILLPTSLLVMGLVLCVIAFLFLLFGFLITNYAEYLGIVLIGLLALCGIGWAVSIVYANIFDALKGQMLKWDDKGYFDDEDAVETRDKSEFADYLHAKRVEKKITLRTLIESTGINACDYMKMEVGIEPPFEDLSEVEEGLGLSEEEKQELERLAEEDRKDWKPVKKDFRPAFIECKMSCTLDLDEYMEMYRKLWKNRRT